MKLQDTKKLESKIIGLTSELAYYKHAYNIKSKQVEDLLSYIRERKGN